jgi:hypothetical protein
VHFYYSDHERRATTRDPLAQRGALEQAGNLQRMPRLKEWCALSIAQWLKGLEDKGTGVSLVSVSRRVSEPPAEQPDQGRLRLALRCGRGTFYLPTCVGSALSRRGSHLMSGRAVESPYRSRCWASHV